MTQAELKELYEKQNRIWERMKELAHGEDGLSNEDREAYLAAEVELDSVIADVEIAERHVKRVEAEEARAAELDDLKVEPHAATEQERADAEAYSDAFWAYTRGGIKALVGDQREILEGGFRALSVGTGSEGGFTAPEGFVAKIIDAISSFSGVRGLSTLTSITTADGNDLPIPNADDTGNIGVLLAENTVVTEQDLAFGQKVLKAFTWSSKMIRVSIQLLQDTGVDVESYLSRKLGERIGRAQAPFFITGTGSAQPEGIITNAATGFTTASAQTTSLLYTDFVEIEHSVDVFYRMGGEYLMSDDALKQARLILDTTNRPLWTPGMVGGFPSTINGHQYTVDLSMAAVAASNKPIAFGNFDNYWMRDVLGIVLRRLDERYADFLQVAFLAFSRTDARPVDAGDDPWKVLAMAAS